MLGGSSIARKLIAMMLVTTGTVVVLACGTLLGYEVITFRRTMVQTLSTLARVVAANSTAALAFENQADATGVLGALSAEPDILSAALYDRNGSLFAKYPANQEDGAFPQGAGQAGYRFSATDLVLNEPVTIDSRQLGVLYLRSDLSGMYERLRLYGGVIAGVIVLSAITALFLSVRLHGYISKPVLALAETAQLVSRDRDYSVRAQRFSDDELGQLTDAFNSMLARVGQQNRELRDQGDQLRHEVDARAHAEEEVRALNAGLELRVAERTEALAAVNKELESFSYSVSHDLRAPLRHVLGYLEMLREDLGTLSESSQRYFDTVCKAATHMGRLIDDLLKFSRTGRSEMCQTTVSLDGVVKSVIQELDMATNGRNITWNIEPLPGVVGDPSLLHQVFVNLIDNAVKYTRDRNPACIAIGSSKSEDGRVVFFVRDNGAGFDMKYAGKLFGVFQRLHRAEEFEGTGIGLATVQRIVDRHGGTIWAESAVDQGTTFYFTLRLAESRLRDGIS